MQTKRQVAYAAAIRKLTAADGRKPTIGDLARELQVSRQAVSLVLRRMIKGGLIEYGGRGQGPKITGMKSWDQRKAANGRLELVVRRLWREKQRPPTYREIAATLKVSLGWISAQVRAARNEGHYWSTMVGKGRSPGPREQATTARLRPSKEPLTPNQLAELEASNRARRKLGL